MGMLPSYLHCTTVRRRGLELVGQDLARLLQIPHLFVSLHLVSNPANDALGLGEMLHVRVVNGELGLDNLSLLLARRLDMPRPHVDSIHHDLPRLPVHLGDLSDLALVSTGNNLDGVPSLDMQVQQDRLAVARQRLMLPVLAGSLW